MGIQHQSLAAGRWHALPLAEQMAHIGSEVHRAAQAREKDTASFEAACVRALELFDLTLGDPRLRKRLKEVARAREFFCVATSAPNSSGGELAALDRYFYPFAVLARKDTAARRASQIA